MNAELQTVDGAAEAGDIPPRFAGPIPAEGPLEPTEGVEAFLRALEAGTPWYDALLDVVARWVAPDEDVGGVTYRYLVGGEAFDWLRLAQRLIEAADLWLPGTVPAIEAERLLFAGLAPGREDEDAFARAIGPQKHRAHLNFQYGVIVEEALLLAAEQELQKAGSLSGARRADIEAYERVYGKPFDELLVQYAEETEIVLTDSVDRDDLQAFTYWCSKYRFRTAEPARVASDTRKSLALLSTMDRHRRRVHRTRAEPQPDEDAIEIGKSAPEPESRPAQTSMWERARRSRARAEDQGEIEP